VWRRRCKCDYLFIFNCRCEIVDEIVLTPVCVTVTDQQVEHFWILMFRKSKQFWIQILGASINYVIQFFSHFYHPSPLSYEQLFGLQIPKVPKNPNDLTVFFALLGSGCVKAVCKMFINLTPGRRGLWRKGDRRHLLRTWMQARNWNGNFP